MKYQVLFSLEDNEEIFMNVVCCGCDWRFKGWFLKFRRYHNFANLFSKFSENTCYKEISKFQ